jgi:hypothetical protein
MPALPHGFRLAVAHHDAHGIGFTLPLPRGFESGLLPLRPEDADLFRRHLASAPLLVPVSGIGNFFDFEYRHLRRSFFIEFR